MAETEGADAGRPPRLLFVCSGNTCRSPMARALAEASARRRGVEVECRSAGTSAVESAPASRGAVLAARELDLDLTGHASSRLGPALAEWADLVLCMEEGHLQAVARMAGQSRAALVTEFLPEGDPERGAQVGDPVGHGLEVYRETLELLREAVEGVMEEVTAPGGPRRGEGDG